MAHQGKTTGKRLKIKPFGGFFMLEILCSKQPGTSKNKGRYYGITTYL